MKTQTRIIEADRFTSISFDGDELNDIIDFAIQNQSEDSCLEGAPTSIAKDCSSVSLSGLNIPMSEDDTPEIKREPFIGKAVDADGNIIFLTASNDSKKFYATKTIEQALLTIPLIQDE